MGHLVYWSRDPERSFAFYRERLGFCVTNSFQNNGGKFARANTPSPFYATMGLKNALAMARSGFSTVRDLGGPMDASIAVRDALREGSFVGPRLLIAD